MRSGLTVSCADLMGCLARLLRELSFYPFRSPLSPGPLPLSRTWPEHLDLPALGYGNSRHATSASFNVIGSLDDLDVDQVSEPPALIVRYCTRPIY